MTHSTLSKVLKSAVLLLGVGLFAGCAGADGHGESLSGDMVMPMGDQTADSDEDPCWSRAEGCPCYTEGEQLDCGRVYRQSGDYVSCSIGSQTCEDGVWGACIGDHIVDLGPDDVPPSYMMATQTESGG